MDSLKLSEIIAIIYKRWIERIGLPDGRTNTNISVTSALSELIKQEEIEKNGIVKAKKV